MKVRSRMGFTFAIAAFVAITAGCPVDWQEVPVPDPVIYLPFDGNFANAGTTGFTAILYGDEIDFLPGKIGQAVFFGGTSDWLDIATDATLDLSSGATLVLWLNRADWTNPYTGGSGAYTPASMDWISVNILSGQSPYLGCLAGAYNDPQWLIAENREIASDTWYHVAVSLDNVTGQSILYLNGVNIADVSHDSGLSPVRNQVRIGTWHEDNQAFRGYVDELAVYNSPLSRDQIRTIYMRE